MKMSLPHVLGKPPQFCFIPFIINFSIFFVHHTYTMLRNAKKDETVPSVTVIIELQKLYQLHDSSFNIQLPKIIAHLWHFHGALLLKTQT